MYLLICKFKFVSDLNFKLDFNLSYSNIVILSKLYKIQSYIQFYYRIIKKIYVLGVNKYLYIV